MTERATRIGAATLLLGIGGCQRYLPQPLTDAAVDARLQPPTQEGLRVAASRLRHPMLPALQLHFQDGLTPDEAAVLAVLVNPDLKAARNQRGLAAAALLKAGILPNPVIGYSTDFNNGGNLAGTYNAYGLTVSWDVEQLISHNAKVKAADLSAQSIDLSIAWQEWQVAEAAKQAVYDLVFLQAQLAVLEEIDNRLGANLKTIQDATALGLETAVELSAAEAASRDAHSATLQAQSDVEHQWFQLTRALGLPPNDRLRLRTEPALASRLDVPDSTALSHDFEQQRIDLIALRVGYESQEQTLRAAILDQFPKLNLGVNNASDNTNVHSLGLVATVDLPIFDRNQGVIATERATRQKLFDEYVSRVFDARADIATAVSDLNALAAQIADAEAAIPNQQRLVDSYKRATELGGADVLSYYFAWNNLAQRRLAVLKLRQKMADTRIALELASGRYWPNAPAGASATQPAVKS